MTTVEQLPVISPAKLNDIRVQMVKFAMLQLNDLDLAEDVVQESFIAAYKNAHSFRGEAALKTWIFAILKYKIIDLFRHRQRYVNVSEIWNDEPQDFFDQTGYWLHSSASWCDIESATKQKEFWAIFDLCLNKLPAQQARIFMMREHLEFSSEQICNECDISTSNLHVILHRARLQLQRCLSKNWFEDEKC